MKTIIALLILIGTSLSQAQVSSSDRFYPAAKYMIVDSTARRIDAAAKGDFANVCRVAPMKPGSPAIDTMAYALSFEIFDNPSLSERFFKDVGPFVARNYESMYRQRLPRLLHESCMSGETQKIKKTIQAIFAISILE